MRHSSFVFTSAALSIAGLFAVSGTAHAADEPAASGTQPAPTTQPAQPATPNEKPQVEEEPEMKRFAVEINPLAAAIGRYSIQGEFMLARHHAATLNPFFAYAPVTSTVNGKEVDLGSLTGFGGELGYRFYTGSKGMNGFFVGPSLIFASYSQSAPSNLPQGATASSDSFLSYGGAVDIGGQGVIGPGIVLGGGFGLQYTTTSKDINTDNLNLASAIIAGGGIRPRFLVTAGYAF